ncbi:hypothetical protein [Desulfurobacterium sp. TC5-1]|uniref:hypothetical protein n=1 Tax=Desulfurobacterium sp. TC5-1 TaxID=1158318 RepID=UPI0003B5DA73|nr:hypothetical protein [Desulfurobacterium sp. TC5-1]
MEFRACEALKRYDGELAEWICSLSAPVVDDIEEKNGTVQLPVLKLNTELSRQKYCYYEHDELHELPYPLIAIPIKVFSTYVIWDRTNKRVFRNFFDEYVARKFPRPENSTVFSVINIAFYLPDVHKIGFMIGIKSVAEFAREFKDALKNIVIEKKRSGEDPRISAHSVMLTSRKRVIEKDGRKITYYVPDFSINVGKGIDAEFAKELKSFIEEYREYRKRLNMESLKVAEGHESGEDIDDIDI